MTKDRFLRGALILTLAGLMVKIVGSVNRIFLSRLLGGEGIGLYQIAYPIYLLISAVSAAGIPVAISIMVSRKAAQKDYGGANRIFRISLSLMVVLGLVLSAVLYFAAGALVEYHIIRDVRAYTALLALIPAVFFSTILASFRGYFQGYQLMTPPAVSQILEQLVRVVTMLVMAYMLLPQGLEYAAAGAAFGAVPGAITGLVVLSVFYVYYRRLWCDKLQCVANTAGESVRVIAERLVRLALPVSAANLMLPLVNGIDMLVVPGRLESAGFTVAAATTAFGYLTGMALPLIMMGTIPTVALAASVVPAISEARALNNAAVAGNKGRMAVRLCFLLTIPAALGMWALAEPISLLLYGTAKAAPSIAHLSPSLAFLGLYQVSTGILQGSGMQLVPMLNMLVSAVVKVFFVWQLTALPQYNIVGAAWASDLNFALAALLNCVCLKKFTEFSFPLLSFGKIISAALVMALGARMVFSLGMECLWGNVVSTFVAIVAGAVFYVLLLLLFREFSEQEMQSAAFWRKNKK